MRLQGNDISKTNRSVSLSASCKRLRSFAYKLYNLTPEEIAIAENS